MSYIVPLVAAGFFVCGILVFLIKGVPFFEPSFQKGFPEELKPFYEMNKCRYRATANPRHKVLPELEKIAKIQDQTNLSEVVINTISYNFNYEGYAPGDKWYQSICQILEGQGQVNLVGGIPAITRRKDLGKLSAKGANIRFLDTPPTTHLFIYLHEDVPKFIWFEKDHREKKATCIAYTRSPSFEDGKLARDYFRKVWDMGRAMHNEQQVATANGRFNN